MHPAQIRWPNLPLEITKHMYDDLAICPPIMCTNTYSGSIPQTKENDMNDQFYNERRYLNSRLYDALYAKERPLKEAFGLAETIPNTGADMVAAFQAGKYVINEDGDLEWRDPAIKKDVPGFQKAWEQVTADKQAAQDIITVSDPTVGLKALQDFQAKTYH